MQQATKPELDRWKVLIPKRDGSAFLLITAKTGLALPEVAVPSQTRLAWNLNAELRNRWGLEVVSLFPLPVLPSTEVQNPPRYHVAELVSPNAPLPAELRWIPASTLSEQLFREAHDYSPIQEFLEAPCADCSKAPFRRLGWFEDIRGWVRDSITSFGLRWDGRFEQFQASESFSLIRFETNGPAVWFKAVGPPNQREFPLTVELAALFPAHLPRVVGVHADFPGWLAEEVSGPRLSDEPDVDRWKTAATVLARLQMQSIPHVRRLAELGARDARPKTLLRFVEPYFETMAILMARQTKPTPAPVSRRDLRQTTAQITGALRQMEELNFPDTLGHFDCNPGNIIVSQEHCVFLDWAEASVGPPFLTFEYFNRHFLRTVPDSAAQHEILLSEYLRSWRNLLSPAQIQKAMALAPLLALLTHAVCNEAWVLSEADLEPALAAYFRSLTRQMVRESQKLQEGYSLCESQRHT